MQWLAAGPEPSGPVYNPEMPLSQMQNAPHSNTHRKFLNSLSNTPALDRFHQVDKQEVKRAKKQELEELKRKKVVLEHAIKELDSGVVDTQDKVSRNKLKEKQLQRPDIFDKEAMDLIELYATDLVALGLDVKTAGKFPSFDMMHAHCEIIVPTEKKCRDAYNELKKLTDESKDTANP